MMIFLHKNAATTPTIRQKIAQSDEAVAVWRCAIPSAKTLSGNAKRETTSRIVRIRLIGRRQRRNAPES